MHQILQDGKRKMPEYEDKNEGHCLTAQLITDDFEKMEILQAQVATRDVELTVNRVVRRRLANA